MELRTQYWTVIVACVLSLPLAYLVLFLMKITVAIMVWAVIIVVVVGGALLAAWLIYMGCSIEKENEYRQAIYGYSDSKAASSVVWLKLFGSIFAIIAGVGLLVALCFIRAIRTGIAVIQVATDALRKLFGLIFVPLAFAPIALVHVGWTAAIAYLVNCTGAFDVKYNEFNFVRYSEGADSRVQSQTDGVGLFSFMLMIFAVFWGAFFIYSTLEFLLSAAVT